jgi:hypothetical protein
MHKKDFLFTDENERITGVSGNRQTFLRFVTDITLLLKYRKIGVSKVESRQSPVT